MEGGLLSKIKEEFKDLLWKDLDVFSWRHKGRVGIKPKVNCHYLKIDPMTSHIDKREGPSTRKDIRP